MSGKVFAKNRTSAATPHNYSTIDRQQMISIDNIYDKLVMRNHQRPQTGKIFEVNY
jgi:hypothetical protein